MKRQVIILTAVLVMVAAGASAQVRTPPCDYWCQLLNLPREIPQRVIPDDPRPYIMPRSVGAWSQFNDMSEGPQPWWSITTGRPFWQTLELARDNHGLTAVGFGLRAHPTINYWENIRRAFRTPGVDVLVLWVTHWAGVEPQCGGGNYVAWQNVPPTIFEDLYKFYAGQDKAVIVMTFESDNRLHGAGCQDRDKCIPWGWYWNDCPAVCEEQRFYDPTWPIDHGWWFPDGYIQPEDCRSICCDMSKSVRRDYMVRKYSELQAAAEAARAAHPGAKLRVFFGIEVDRYGREGEWLTTGRDVIPFMVSPPDFIGLSCWPAKCGETENEVTESFNRVMDWTGLPSYRLFVAEVGAREMQPGDQYARITTVVPPLFALGAPLALVWSLEQSSEGQFTTHALIDQVTGEYRSGMAAIRELNEEYR